jgi:uncharacterized DUF497 family protein
MSFEWDPQKAEANFKKHGVRFPEAEPVFEDDYAITIKDDESDSGEQRFVSMGMGEGAGFWWWWCTATAAATFASSPRGWRRRRNEGNTRRPDEGQIRFQ